MFKTVLGGLKSLLSVNESSSPILARTDWIVKVKEEVYRDDFHSSFYKKLSHIETA